MKPEAQTIQERLARPDGVDEVTGWLRTHPAGSRQALALHLGKHLGLKNRKGSIRLAGIHKALRILEQRRLWCLPKSSNVTRRKPQSRRLNHAVALPCAVPTQAEQIENLSLVEVDTRNAELFRTWNELMLTEHPQRNSRLVGRQMRYLLGSTQGWLGAIGFGSCALRMQARDEWIGWDDTCRKAYQERVISMTRFLIRPSVRCQNLASRALGLCAQQVATDFARRYGFEPWLLESFVNATQYAGTCYQAANWLYVGQSVGRGRNGPHGQPTDCKDIYLYELHRNWRQDMGLTPKSERLTPLGLEETARQADWVETEFGGVDLGHRDTDQRLLLLAQAKAQNPAAPYTECFRGNRHDLKAYYRFIGHSRAAVNPDAMMATHRRQTCRRIKAHKRVLIIQDTSDLNFSERLHCNGLGDIGKNQTGCVSHGLKLHSALSVTEHGLPLGVLKAHVYASHFDGKGEKDRPIEEKESFRWLRTINDLREASEWIGSGTELIAVGDRESDLFELFDHRRRKAPNIHLLVRAQHNRNLADSKEKLFDHLNDLPVMGEARIEVPRQREKKGKPGKPGRIGLPARQARVQLRWQVVTLAAPDNTSQTRQMPPISLYAVSVVESNPPPDATALRWILLTTVPIPSRKQALRCLRWYTLRWRIEEWHRILKSGCRIEAHQHQTAERLGRAIAIDTVIAWRLMLLTLLGRQTPELPCQLIFSSWECQLLEKLQPLVAPETMRSQKKRKRSTSARPTSSSHGSAEPFIATSGNASVHKRYFAGSVASTISHSGSLCAKASL